LIAGAAKPNVVVLIGWNVIQIERKDSGVRFIIPIAAPFEGIFIFPYLK